MHEYAVTFRAAHLDESALRDFLAAQGIEEVTISRKGAPSTSAGVGKSDPVAEKPLTGGVAEDDATPLNPRQAIEAVARKRKTFSVADVHDMYPQHSMSRLAQAASHVYRNGGLKRVSRGIYLSAEEPMPEAAAASETVGDEQNLSDKDREILGLLEHPRTVSEIYQSVGTTRQAVTSRMPLLMGAGLAFHISVFGASLYARNIDALNAEAKRRLKELPDEIRGILNTLPDAGAILRKDIGAHLAIDAPTLAGMIDSMAAEGLVEVQTIGRPVFVRLAQKGRCHVARSPDAKRLDPVDLRKEFSPIRTDILIALDAQGPLRPRQIRVAVQSLGDGYSDGHVYGVLSKMRQNEFLSADEDGGVSDEERKLRLGPRSEQVLPWIRGCVASSHQEAIRRAPKE